MNPAKISIGLDSKLPGSSGAAQREIVAFDWTVLTLDGDSIARVRRDQTASPGSDAIVGVPPHGAFRVVLAVLLKNGSSISAAERYQVRDFLVVSLGDSFSSGQGNPDVPANPSVSDVAACEAVTLQQLKAKVAELPVVGLLVSGVDLVGELITGPIDFLVGLFTDADSSLARWQEPRAYRSYRSGPSLAAMELRTISESRTDNVIFLSFARSGAEIRNGLLGPRANGRDNWIGRGEVDEARRATSGRRIDALLISIGGNDIGFAGSLVDLVTKDQLTWFGDGEVRVKARQNAERRLRELPDALDDLRDAIDEKLRPRQTYLLEYPTGLFEITKAGAPVDGGPCGIFASSLDMDLDINDGRLVQALARRLNEVLRAKAQQFGWFFIDGIADDFAGHGYCASESFWVSAEQSCRSQGDFEGMMHPNATGQALVKSRIQRALTENMLEP